ncbi:MAG: superoxide dismutase [Firmicutes bacterium]|nr:superoxide dismutase [Bacillota bacterium]
MKNPYNYYPYELKPLNFAYSALEPFIDERTMKIHHDKHLQTYVNNLNTALKDYPKLQDKRLEELLSEPAQIPEEIRTAVINNGGGVFNHNFYFDNLAPKGENGTADILLKDISAKFGSYEAFKSAFKASALAVFGSGYSWLALSREGLKIVNTKNQDTLLPLDMRPIMCIDVWEHAYYLKHQNLRADYINDWFEVINLKEAQMNYLSSVF